MRALAVVAAISALVLGGVFACAGILVLGVLFLGLVATRGGERWTWAILGLGVVVLVHGIGIGTDRCVRCGAEAGTREDTLFSARILTFRGSPGSGAPAWTGLPDWRSCAHEWRRARRCHYTLVGVGCSFGPGLPIWEEGTVDGDALRRLADRDRDLACRWIESSLRADPWAAKDRFSLPQPVPAAADPPERWEAWFLECRDRAPE